MTRQVRVWGPAWAMMVLIFVLSSMSQLPPVPGGFDVDDGVAHAVAYGVLAALLLRGLAGGALRRVSVEAAGLAMAEPSDFVVVMARQAPGTWLPLRVARDGAPLEIIAKFPAIR